MEKKPRIGQMVYCIYRGSYITAEPVFMIGKESFLLNPYDTEPDSWEWYYKDYDEAWFTNLSKAKKRLLDINKSWIEQKKKEGIKLKIVEAESSGYALEVVD